MNPAHPAPTSLLGTPLNRLDATTALGAPPTPWLLGLLDRIKRVYASAPGEYRPQVEGEIERLFLEYQHVILGVFVGLLREGLVAPDHLAPFQAALDSVGRRLQALEHLPEVGPAPAVEPPFPEPARTARPFHSVRIFPETADGSVAAGQMPRGARAFGLVRVPSGELGIRLVAHDDLFGLRASEVLRTGSEAELRRYAHSVARRYKRQPWVFDSHPAH